MSKKNKNKHKKNKTAPVTDASKTEANVEENTEQSEADVEPSCGKGDSEDKAGDKSKAKLKDEVQTESSLLETAIKERDEYLELSQRTRADLENFRKRAQREKENQKVMIIGSLLKELLSPVDDLNRAIIDAEETADFDTLFSGLKIVRDDLWKALKTVDFEKIEAGKGTDFDPNIHEAMMQIPHEEIAQNKIVEEFTPGYKIGDYVLRPSKVGISSGKPTS